MARVGQDDLKKAEVIKTVAREIGFDAVVIAPPARALHGEAFCAWLDKGYQADMAYMARNQDARLDITSRYPWVKSIVIAALHYKQPPAPDKSFLSRIAQFAWSGDYHDIVSDMLARLGCDIQQRTGCDMRSRVYVDTGPILERDLAASAGLGWVGKNTMLVSERLGSYFLIGELLTDLELPFDSPVASRCGTCTRCMDACPTGALREPYVLDSARCISYLTIEHKQDIPEDKRARIGERIFGCDICQSVCPWNRKTPVNQHETLLPKQSYQELSLGDLIEITQERFREVFAKTPFHRLKYSGLKRNALIVAGNTCDQGVFEAVEGALEDSDPVIRKTAAWALKRINQQR